jgi:hypothetical protein
VSAPFDDSLRRRKSAAFDLEHNSTARHTVTFPLWGRPVTAYANANLSVYSAQTCNAKCAFCVEELRPASRGRSLTVQRTIEADDERYFAALDEVLVEVAPLSPTLSITGGEPSKDPRLSRILTAVGRTARGSSTRAARTAPARDESSMRSPMPPSRTSTSAAPTRSTTRTGVSWRSARGSRTASSPKWSR